MRSLWWLVLNRVTLEAGSHAPLYIAWGGGGAESQGRNVPGLRQGDELLIGLEPVHAGKIDVEDNQVRPALPGPSVS